MTPALQIALKAEKLIVGLISGTSADGIDAAVVRVKDRGLDVKIDVLAFATYAYPPEIRARVLAVSRPGAGSVDEICRLHVAVGECFASAALQVIASLNLETAQIDLIGSHGQTIHHLPTAEPIAGMPTRGTLQIGEPSVIAKRTGIVTIADFRPADMALGGQGAPLVPLMDYLLFRSAEKSRGVLNLGGIANLTFLKRNADREEVIAYDTGPANMVMDGLMQKLYRCDYDEEGRVAARGIVSNELLSRLLAHPYFALTFPKSTGREEFGEAFVEDFLAQARQFHLKDEDIIATATALTAATVWQEAQRLQTRLGNMDELIVSGGGAHNRTLINFLQQRFLSIRILKTDDFGIPSDAKEAILMAILANETISGHAGNVPSVTGAKKGAVLGKICL
ncbi:MAG: anhydro-N-acetylmuramic acid kinase [bacterium]